MNSIEQHIPNFVDTDEEPRIVQFENNDELFRIDFVKRFSDSQTFDHFAMSEQFLMAVYDDGKRWLVVGKVALQLKQRLPEWYPPPGVIT